MLPPHPTRPTPISSQTHLPPTPNPPQLHPETSAEMTKLMAEENVAMAEFTASIREETALPSWGRRLRGPNWVGVEMTYGEKRC